MADFYDDRPQPSLRFGDVITGFQFVAPQVNRPGSIAIGSEITIAVSRPAYFAVMTPCCSIENRCLALSPLVSLRAAFLGNPHFKEDLTRINRKVPPEKTVAPEIWEKKLGEERRQALRALGESYTLLECFIYAPHPRLAEYDLPMKGGALRLGHYLVDFKSIYRIDSDAIERGKPPPLGIKLLQLAVPVREQLRQKLAFFFARIPDEDKALV